jgi:hypothetical protein
MKKPMKEVQKNKLTNNTQIEIPSNNNQQQPSINIRKQYPIRKTNNDK